MIRQILRKFGYIPLQELQYHQEQKLEKERKEIMLKKYLEFFKWEIRDFLHHTGVNIEDGELIIKYECCDTKFTLSKESANVLNFIGEMIPNLVTRDIEAIEGENNILKIYDSEIANKPYMKKMAHLPAKYWVHLYSRIMITNDPEGSIENVLDRYKNYDIGRKGCEYLNYFSKE